MEKRLRDYLETCRLLAAQAKETGSAPGPEELERRRQEMLVQIGFFQHERLIHLIVTVTFAVLAFLTLIGCVLSFQIPLLLLELLLLVLLIPYIRHYYILENGVQKLYTYYDILEQASR